MALSVSRAILYKNEELKIFAYKECYYEVRTAKVSSLKVFVFNGLKLEGANALSSVSELLYPNYNDLTESEVPTVLGSSYIFSSIGGSITGQSERSRTVICYYKENSNGGIELLFLNDYSCNNRYSNQNYSRLFTITCTYDEAAYEKYLALYGGDTA